MCDYIMSECWLCDYIMSECWLCDYIMSECCMLGCDCILLGNVLLQSW